MEMKHDRTGKGEPRGQLTRLKLTSTVTIKERSLRIHAHSSPWSLRELSQAAPIRRRVFKTNSQIDVSNEQNGTDCGRRQCKPVLCVRTQICRWTES